MKEKVTFGVKEIYSTLILVYIFIRTQCTVHLKWVHFCIYCVRLIVNYISTWLFKKTPMRAKKQAK